MQSTGRHTFKNGKSFENPKIKRKNIQEIKLHISAQLSYSKLQ